MRKLFVSLLAFSLSAAISFSAPLAAQQGLISGRVTDESTSQPLAQAQVQVLGGVEVGALTDAQGDFRLSVAPGSYSIVVILLGYETQRVDGLSVSPGATERLDIAMRSTALALDPISVTVTRGREERTLSAPAHVNVATAETIEEIAATTPVDYVKAMPGVDVVQYGISQSNTVARGFNAVLSGSLLVLTDHRYARIPRGGQNAFNYIPMTPLDLERVEVVLGPASALYGPNSANGVLHFITKSPLDAPGTTVSLSGGSRSIFHGVVRQAWAFNDGVGLKVSGQYFRGHDFEYRDPVEEAAAAVSPNPLVGARDFESERYGGEMRLDLRPWEEGDQLVFTYGIQHVGSAVEMVPVGAAQAKDWRVQFGQARLNKGRFFAQAFLNKNSAGDSYILRTGEVLVDNSMTLATQAQYGFGVGGRLDATVGVDYSLVMPRTEGTLHGSNEDVDETIQVGGYIHTTTTLSDRLDLVAALRIDHHEHLGNPFTSPRAGLVFEPVQGHNFRATYNRSFGTPGTDHFFIDMAAGFLPLGPTVGYGIRVSGVPKTGFTFSNTCSGGVGDYCMYSPFAPGVQLPASGAALWDDVVVPLALADPALLATLQLAGLTPETFASIVGNPQAGELSSMFLRLNTENPSIPFVPDSGPVAVPRLKPTVTTAYELGYTGLIGEKLRLAVALYRTDVRDFVGSPRVETPTVFLDGNSVGAFLISRLTDAGVPTSIANDIAAGIAPVAAQLPLGTVAPDQRSDSDQMLISRSFGEIDLYGADIGLELHATDKVTLTGSYSYLSKECMDFNDDGSCFGVTDVALNAPKNKGSLGGQFDDKSSGVFIGGRIRYNDGFPMNSGVYVGDVEGYTVVDVNGGYRVPGYKGLIISATINNLFNNKHREWIGAPELGFLGLLKVQFEM